MLFFQFGDLVVDAFQFGLSCVQRFLFGGQVLGHDIGLGQQIAGPAFVAGFAFLVGFLNAARLCYPAVSGDQVGVVLEGFRPVVHQVLVDGVGVQQRRSTEGGQQGF